MNSNLTDTLDRALARWQAGESPKVILADYPAHNPALTDLLTTAATLETLRPVEMPTSEALLADRNEFLYNIPAYRLQAVSPGPLARLKEWIVHHLSWQLIYQGKEQRRMSTLFIKVMVIAGVVVGSLGGTAALAANSLPDSPLYPVKMVMEQVQVNMAADPAAQAVVVQNQVRTRIQEMVRLVEAGQVPDEAVLTRLQTQLHQALHLAAQAPDETMPGLLLQFRHEIKNQEQLLTQAQAQTVGSAEEALQQAKQWLNQAGQDVEYGLSHQQEFRFKYACAGDDCEQTQQQIQTQEQNQEQMGPGSECGEGNCEQPQNQVQNQYRYQNQQGEPDNGCNGDDCDQPQSQVQNQYQHQNQEQAGADNDCSGNDCDQPQLQQQNRDRDRDRDRDKDGDCDPDSDQNDCDQLRQRDRLKDQTQDPDQQQTQDRVRDQKRDNTCDEACSQTRAWEQNQEQIRDAQREWSRRNQNQTQTQEQEQQQQQEQKQEQEQTGQPVDPGNQNAGNNNGGGDNSSGSDNGNDDGGSDNGGGGNDNGGSGNSDGSDNGDGGSDNGNGGGNGDSGGGDGGGSGNGGGKNN